MKKTNRREDLLIAASKIFSKKGYHATSITDIGNKANVARGTVYLYFKSKRDIFETLIQDFSTSILKTISLISNEKSPIEQFNENIRKIIDIVVKNKHLTKIISSEAVGLDAEFDHQLILFYTKLVEYTEGALIMLQKNNYIPENTNVRILAYSIIGLIKEISYQWSIDYGDLLDLSLLVSELKSFDLKNYINFKKVKK